ncbi:MAG TPA: hypothetical protein V6C91_07830 [Coleofasciculaceae cyanobacterium]
MLKQIWQWLKGLFRRLFGGGTSSQSLSYQNRLTSSSPFKEEIGGQQAPPPLSDSDYEYLFRQLLEGVSHRWQQDRIVRWFEALQGRISKADWVAWLQRFGDRVLASPSLNNELGMRLVVLAEQIETVPSLREIGEVAYNIGRQLLGRDTSSGVVWEYEGPDNTVPVSPSPLPVEQQEEEPINQEDQETVETITLDELLLRLQQDPSLLQMVADQLGIETNNPQVIIQELLNQFNVAAQSAPDDGSSQATQE